MNPGLQAHDHLDQPLVIKIDIFAKAKSNYRGYNPKFVVQISI